jgi:predicted molibdopterin-dependent oxidoreductase YjgC
MFRPLHEMSAGLTVHVDGAAVPATAGQTVMALLLTMGRIVFRRSAASGQPRGPYCGMGVCFECLVTIDGAANRQACLTQVREGMRIETGHAAPELREGRR